MFLQNWTNGYNKEFYGVNTSGVTSAEIAVDQTFLGQSMADSADALHVAGTLAKLVPNIKP